MAQKLSKKGRNPGAVDNWLEALGYYRKNVAYDETCLFRAVSEQVINSEFYRQVSNIFPLYHFSSYSIFKHIMSESELTA